MSEHSAALLIDDILEALTWISSEPSRGKTCQTLYPKSPPCRSRGL